MTTTETRPPLPPFTRESALKKVRAAEDGWNTRNPQKVSLAYTEDSMWRNRAEFLHGRPAIVAFLTRKWAKELDYRLIKELWSFQRFASINDLPITAADRKYHWDASGPRPADHPELSDLGL